MILFVAKFPNWRQIRIRVVVVAIRLVKKEMWSGYIMHEEISLLLT